VRSRRTVLQLAGVSALTGFGGCLSGFQRGGVSVRIDNRDDQQHTVGVTFGTGDETAFDDQYSIAAGAEETWSDVVDPGEYSVTVELDSSKSASLEFDMAGCDSNTLFVSIDAGSEFEASVLDEC
jgi:hypothetical protein